MPNTYVRPPFKFVSKGVSLAHPVDAMPDGLYPILVNVQPDQEGRLVTRPGITLIFDADPPA